MKKSRHTLFKTLRVGLGWLVKDELDDAHVHVLKTQHDDSIVTIVGQKSASHIPPPQ